MNNYDDIINMTHHVSSKRTPMPIEKRAAQFAPFSALTGYEDKINEIKRITDKKIQIDETRKTILNNKLQILYNNIINKPIIEITYFIKDIKKEGGKYITNIEIIKKIDIYQRQIILEDNTKINFEDIYDIKGNIFSEINKENY